MTMYVIREQMFRLGEDSDITDEAGRPVLHVDGKVMSLHNRLVLTDPAGHEAGQVHRKLAALRPTYVITVDGTDVAEVRKHLLTAWHDRSPSTSAAPDTWRSSAIRSATNSRSAATARRSRLSPNAG
jgi:uncharacterized protein YxjI